MSKTAPVPVSRGYLISHNNCHLFKKNLWGKKVKGVSCEDLGFLQGLGSSWYLSRCGSHLPERVEPSVCTAAHTLFKRLSLCPGCPLAQTGSGEMKTDRRETEKGH